VINADILFGKENYVIVVPGSFGRILKSSEMKKSASRNCSLEKEQRIILQKTKNIYLLSDNRSREQGSEV
jgi:hypothetical protein